MKKVTINTNMVEKHYSNSIVKLQRAKSADGYNDGAMAFLAGWLGSKLVEVIDQLPKAKRAEVLAGMARDTLKFEAQAEVYTEITKA
jgi:hypothetical protein